jgi:hypothetical protein
MSNPQRSTEPQVLEVRTAADTYRRRRDRDEHPAGAFDDGGRWYPEFAEAQTCCRHVRRPSRAWPYSLLLHCRTLAHVAALHGVAPAEVRRAVRRGAVPVVPVVVRRPVRRDDAPAVAERHIDWPAGAAAVEPAPTITPEATAREALWDAGIDDRRQAEYQRRLSSLLAGRP